MYSIFKHKKNKKIFRINGQEFATFLQPLMNLCYWLLRPNGLNNGAYDRIWILGFASSKTSSVLHFNLHSWKFQISRTYAFVGFQKDIQ
jgi:hypothetical protein